MDASLRLAAMLRSGDGTATNILRAYDLFHEAAEAQLQGEDFGARFYRMAKISAAELRKEIDDQVRHTVGANQPHARACQRNRRALGVPRAIGPHRQHQPTTTPCTG